jgi:hypothetical protein
MSGQRQIRISIADMKSIDELIKEALALFPESYRPDNFADPGHCEECRDHNETLLGTTREEITFDELGNPGWDPICFINEDGFKYYFPALVRLALNGTGNEYYITQFLFHITENASCKGFSKEQSAYVVNILEYLIENRSKELDDYAETDDVLNAIELWSKK